MKQKGKTTTKHEHLESIACYERKTFKSFLSE